MSVLTNSIASEPAAMAAKPPRSVAVDLVRVVGVIAIVAGHTWDDRHFAQVGLYTWHVPVFFVLTGYLWKPNRTTWDETKRRARTLLVPYICWIVIVSVITFTFEAHLGKPFNHELVANLFKGGWYISRPYSAYWFVTALFFAAVLMRFLVNVHRWLPWIVGGAGIAWCIMDPISIKMIPESAGLALPAVAYICIGLALRHVRAQIDKPFRFGLIVFIPAFYLGAQGIIVTLNMKSGLLGTPVLGFLMSAAISIGLLLMAEGSEFLLPGWVRKVILVLAQTAIPIILTHTLVLAITEAYGIPDSKWTFLLAYFAPLALALLLRLTPARKVLF